MKAFLCFLGGGSQHFGSLKMEEQATNQTVWSLVTLYPELRLLTISTIAAQSDDGGCRLWSEHKKGTSKWAKTIAVTLVLPLWCWPVEAQNATKLFITKHDSDVIRVVWIILASCSERYQLRKVGGHMAWIKFCFALNGCLHRKRVEVVTRDREASVKFSDL